MAFVLSVIALCAGGCGTAHIFSTTHTHIYMDQPIDTDDVQTARLIAFMEYLQALQAEEADPLKGFKWDDKVITTMEKKQKKGNFDDSHF